MSTQILCYQQSSLALPERDEITNNSFSTAAEFDAFALTIINLQDKKIWRNNRSSNKSIDIQSDIKTLGSMINRSSSCKVLLLLPQDECFQYDYSKYERRYTESIHLRDMLPALNNEILANLFGRKVSLVFGHTETIISGHTFEADFSLEESSDSHIIPLAPRSNAGSATCFQIRNRLFATTLSVTFGDPLFELCNCLDLLPKTEAPLPEWLNEMTIFDEEQLRHSHTELLGNIEKLEIEKDRIEKTLEQYNETKSILCKKDSELETLVREMLIKILDASANFIDEKEEDYRFETDSSVYVFEIKGAIGGLKRHHISKAHDHVQIVQDDLDEASSTKTAKGVLIFSGQIQTPPSKRDPYPKKQITLAERDEIAVMSAETFLRCYEAKLQENLSATEFLDLISLPGLIVYDTKACTKKNRPDDATE